MYINDYLKSTNQGVANLEKRMQPDRLEVFEKRNRMLDAGEGSRAGCLRTFSSDCEVRAMLAYFRDGDIVVTKHWAYLSSKARIMLAHMEVGNDYLTEELLWPLLSDNEEVIDCYRQNQSMYIPAAVQKQLDAATAAETHGDKQAAAEIYAELATNTVLVTSAITKVVGSASNVLGKNGALLTPAEVASSNVSGSLGKLGGSFDAVTPGPLADNLAATFAGGKYREVTLTKDTVLFRAGSTDNPLGQFFVNEKPAGVIQSRIDSAILPNWPGGGTSPIDAVFAVNIPAGTKVYVGAAGSQGSFYVGGTTQLLLRNLGQLRGWLPKK